MKTDSKVKVTVLNGIPVKEIDLLCEKICGPEQKFKSNGCPHLFTQQILENILNQLN